MEARLGVVEVKEVGPPPEALLVEARLGVVEVEVKEVGPQPEALPVEARTLVAEVEV